MSKRPGRNHSPGFKARRRWPNCRSSMTCTRTSSTKIGRLPAPPTERTATSSERRPKADWLLPTTSGHAGVAQLRI